jgi:hypothetical protein
LALRHFDYAVPKIQITKVERYRSNDHIVYLSFREGRYFAPAEESQRQSFFQQAWLAKLSPWGFLTAFGITLQKVGLLLFGNSPGNSPGLSFMIFMFVLYVSKVALGKAIQAK